MNKFRFLETPRKFVIAKFSIGMLGSSPVLYKEGFEKY